MANDIEQRRNLTFEQAEGLEPLPSQLQLREVSTQLRAVLWHRVHRYFDDSTEHRDYGGAYLDQPWSTILKDEHVWRQHRMTDDFTDDAKELTRQTRAIFEKGNYAGIFGWLEFVLKHGARCA